MRKNVKIIAEIAQAHEGSMELAHKYINALADTGVDAIKFQTHIAAAESSMYEPFRVKFSSVDETRYDYWKRMEFSLEEWKELKKHCNEEGLEFISSPFSNAAIDLLEEVGVNYYKVGSGEVNNLVLLEKLAQTNKPIILSSGMSSFNELDSTINFLKERNVTFSILQCTTAYPTAPEQFGLNVIKELKERYQVPIGYSDHSSKIETCIAATALGAELLEFHAVFDKNSNGPDAKSSLTIDEITDLVKAVRAIETALRNPVDKSKNIQFIKLKNIFEKSLAVNKHLKRGHKLTFEDLETKKPKGYGIDAAKFDKVIGKILKKDLDQWDFLTEEDIK